MSTAMWKLEKDLCRCCHAEGSFKNLSEPCFQLGQEEIYSDMLQECLDVKIVPMMGSLQEITFTICESCVVRLRDATNFKKQVLDCEERFKDMYSRNLIRGFEVKDEPLISDTEDINMKEELQSGDDEEDDTFLNFDDDDLPSDQSEPADVERKTRSKGKTKNKPKAKAKPEKKTKAKKPKDDETELTEAAVSGEKKKGVPPGPKMNRIPYVSIVEDKGVKKYFCSKCDVSFATASSAGLHILAKHTDRKEECPVCDKQFETKAEKKIHLGKYHNLEEVVKGNRQQLREIPKVSCDECKKTYSNNNSLQRHVAEHHSFKKCPDCPSFLPARKMAIHRNDAHGNPIPTCGICGYRNAFENRIIKHQRRVHLREKTVPCNLCDLTFFSADALKLHLIKHKPDKIHECSYCHKKFPRIKSLRLHLMIHKGEKNKVCSLCGKRFVQKSSLNYHMIKHHPDAC